MHIAVRACFSVCVPECAENSIKLNTQSHLAPILLPWHTETWGTNTQGKAWTSVVWMPVTLTWYNWSNFSHCNLSSAGSSCVVCDLICLFKFACIYKTVKKKHSVSRDDEKKWFICVSSLVKLCNVLKKLTNVKYIYI